MKLIPVLLHGNLTEILKYDLGRVENITQGSWELSIKSLAFTLHKAKETPPKVQKPIDEFINVYTNYCQGTIVENAETLLKPYCLSQLHLKLSIKQKRLYPYKSRDYFEISNATRTFEIFFLDQYGEPLKPEVAKHISVSANILFRRIQ